MVPEKAYDDKFDVASNSNSAPHVEFYDPSKESVWTRIGLSLESFKRAPGTTGGIQIAGDLDGVDKEKLRADNPMLQQKMKPRHLAMIAVGGSIGTGLFVGSGAALNAGGPAGVMIAWILMGLMLIILVSVLGTLGYAEEEFWSSCLKLLVVVMFIFIGIICICGGGPKDGEYNHYIGAKYWHEPGAFANGFPGVCAVFVTAAFAFSGTELIGLAASETPNPRATMPGAVKGTFWRITIIYVTSLLIIGMLVPYDEPRLLNGGGAAASPFVIALDRAGIKGLNHFVNATICVSVLSIGLSSVYAGSRTLTALAETGYAPRFFSYVDKSSRPLWSVVATLLFAPLAYINVVAAGNTVFTWLVALSGLSTIFTWMAICLCHIRFRMAWVRQGHSIEELPFKALGGVWGSWFGIILLVLVLIAQFYIAIWPVGGMSDDPKEVVKNFFASYLGFPIILIFWTIGYIWKRTLPKAIADIDLDTGRKSWLTVEEMRAYREARKDAPRYVRIYRMLFSN
ncbi:hypothetical protein C0992_006260 [Termitomyces sp. T32_za158]|nr:hypothetical protein C0992_006260 [Termitomyces sp. T32_za158]